MYKWGKSLECIYDYQFNIQIIIYVSGITHQIHNPVSSVSINVIFMQPHYFYLRNIPIIYKSTQNFEHLILRKLTYMYYLEI